MPHHFDSVSAWALVGGYAEATPAVSGVLKPLVEDFIPSGWAQEFHHFQGNPNQPALA